MVKKFRSLPRLPKIRGEAQKRIPRAGSFSPYVESRIQRLADRMGVSRSGVIVTIVSKYFKYRDGFD